MCCNIPLIKNASNLSQENNVPSQDIYRQQHFKRGNVLIKIQYAVIFSPTIQVLMVLQHAIMEGEGGVTERGRTTLRPCRGYIVYTRTYFDPTIKAVVSKFIVSQARLHQI